MENQRLRLLPDCGGLIETIALSIPAAFFERDEADVGLRPLLPIGNLLSALPHDVVVYILVDQMAFVMAQNWVSVLPIGCTIKLVSVESTQGAIDSLWIQDAIHVACGVGDAHVETEILCKPGSVIGRSVTRYTKFPSSFSDQCLPGGNQLVGPDFRLIGYASLEVRRSKGAVAIDETTRLRDKIKALDDREIRIFGYNGRTDATVGRLLSAGGFALVASELMHQCGFHLDQFVSLTGIDIDERPLLLVARPVIFNGAETRMTSNLKMQLDASVVCLEQQGFHVVRNPMPLAITPDTGKRMPRLYNNIILENDTRMDRTKPFVWIPHFGDQEPLADFDEENRAIWSGLGFDPVPVPGWSSLASRNGAIRCATKILRRRSSQPPSLQK
jgi:hypothetical protein